MSWIVLFVAGLCEVGWAVGLKFTEGFSKPLPSLFTVTAMILSVVLLSAALRTLPVGTSYAVWTGVGTVGTALAGIWLLGESADPLRLSFLLLIVIGITGLRWITP